MTPPYLVLLAIFVTAFGASLSQDVRTNQINDVDNDVTVEEKIEDNSPFVEAAATFAKQAFTSGDQVDVAGILSNIIQADGGKTLENLFGAAGQHGDATSQILSGIGSMLNNQNAGAALDPSLIGNVLSMMGNSDDASEKKPSKDMMHTISNLLANVMTQQKKGGKKDKDSLNVPSLISMVHSYLKESGENPISLLLSLGNSFFGPEAKTRENEHASHAYLMPPLLERAHLYFDHFRHTELYQALWRLTGGDKFFSMFSVDGKFSFPKFFERLENKSFRRHWINVITKRITDIIAVITDPHRHKKYVSTIVSLFNGFLKSLDFPKTTLFDVTRPTDTLTKFFSYFFKKYLSMDVDSKRYVKPAVQYMEEVIRLAQHRGILLKDTIDSQELAHKLTDTLNLEIIEPVVRVYRAYRFAKKVPECDKYVMCLINQEDPKEVLSLPGLKISLSRTASMLASWFLSQQTGTSFWTLYSAINDERDCSVRFVEKCNDFHIQEIKVHEHYEHTEL